MPTGSMLKLVPVFICFPAAAASFLGAFAPVLKHSCVSSQTFSKLQAEAGAPEYEKREVILLKAEPVGNDESVVLLHIEPKPGDAKHFDYLPGNVLGLEIKYDSSRHENLDDKTLADAEQNGGWMRGPYTVSNASHNSLSILLKVVGAKSKAFACAEPGTPLRLGGKFKVPIVQGISENTKRIVMLSTGVGVGPCVGAVEKLLYGSNPYEKIDLISSFRFPNEVIYRDYLSAWEEAYEDKFRYVPVVTDDTGRVGYSDESMQLVASSDYCSLTETHYYLIGNGQMVNEWKTGLLKAGVPKERVSFEVYFNHKAKPCEDTVLRIETAIRESSK